MSANEPITGTAVTKCILAELMSGAADYLDAIIMTPNAITGGLMSAKLAEQIRDLRETLEREAVNLRSHEAAIVTKLGQPNCVRRAS